MSVLCLLCCYLIDYLNTVFIKFTCNESTRDQSLKFNPFDSYEEILTDESFDPDFNFFNSNIVNLDTPYISREEHKNLNVNSSVDRLSILHLNIRRIKENFENFKIFSSKFWLQYNMFFGDVLRRIPFNISIVVWVT